MRVFFLCNGIAMVDQEPCIYTIDIDGTLIGDITYHVAEWEMLSKYDRKKLKTFKTQLIQSLQNGLLRPHVADFITHIKANNNRCEFFLYTASDDKWAQFLVPCIEAACGCKFARPIFSRKHCLIIDKSIKKSLMNISTAVFNKLKNNSTLNLRKPTQVYDNMILIDNNKVLLDKEQRKCIICPSYDYECSYDILRLIDTNILAANSQGIASILQKYDFIDPKESSRASGQFGIIALYYEGYAMTLRTMHKTIIAQERQRRDKFWLNLANAIVALQLKHVNKESIVKYINNKLHASR